MGAVRGFRPAPRSGSVQNAVGGAALCLRLGSGEQYDRGPCKPLTQETGARGYRYGARHRLSPGRRAMIAPHSLQWRLSLWLGLGIAILWAVAAAVTSQKLHHD